MLLFYTPLRSVPHPPVLLSTGSELGVTTYTVGFCNLSLSASVYAEGHLQEFPLLVFLVERNEVAGSLRPTIRPHPPATP